MRSAIPGAVLLRVRDVDARTVIDIVSPDAPYIVESLAAELERARYGIERLLHPQLVVIRDLDGQLVRVHDIDDTAEVPDDAVVESWLHIDLDLVPADRHDALAANLRGVLEDVLHAVADAPAMYQLLRALADRLDADPGQFDRETSEEAGRAAALAGRRQLHDHRSRPVLGQ